ncbi:bifunctional diaminohydroxyphosphoribosylaminopyrimidine deaminase/5-amino-6-(5-phosphoribosylamino)uracil reductase [Candidatus Methylacidiphilaceae bacterium]
MRIRLDEKWMGMAVELAKRAGNSTRPNPRVGAIVVKGGRIVGAGYHRMAGLPHAEIEAIQQAGVKAKGAKLFVTLEPCSTHGRTPPCTDRIVASGIREVIYGAGDVDRRNVGGAGRVLSRKKIRVVEGILREECEKLNEDYRHWTTKKEPWVILKLAMTLDGYLVVPGRRWVTGEVARAEVQKLRAGCDAILVGAETVRKDNPQLTVRKTFRHSAESRNVGGEQPWRVVVTRSGKLPKGANLFRDRYKDRTLVYRKNRWLDVLKDLYRRGVSRLLVEGGAEVAGGLIKAGKVNEVVIYLAPILVGKRGKGLPKIDGWADWGWCEVVSSCAGEDLCLRGKLGGAK